MFTLSSFTDIVNDKHGKKIQKKLQISVCYWKTVFTLKCIYFERVNEKSKDLDDNFGKYEFWVNACKYAYSSSSECQQRNRLRQKTLNHWDKKLGTNIFTYPQILHLLYRMDIVR